MNHDRLNETAKHGARGHARRWLIHKAAWTYVNIYSRLGFSRMTAGGLNLRIVLWLLFNDGFRMLRDKETGRALDIIIRGVNTK
jgi:hypothetical protein